MDDIEADELLKRIQNAEPLNLLDVREPMEFATYNIGGKNIPLGKISVSINQKGFDKEAEIIVVCKMGLRSRTGQEILKQLGFKKVRNLKGGLIALHKIS